MRIYLISGCLDYRHLVWSDSDDDGDEELDFALQFRSETPFENWPIPPIRLATDFEERELEEEAPELAAMRIRNGAGDFPHFSPACLVLSERARKVLGTYFDPYGEIRPITQERESMFFVFHCTNVVDALNHDLSEFEYYQDGDIRDVKQYVFQESLIESNLVFRMRSPSPFNIFVGEKVIAEVKKHRLVGLQADMIYDSTKDSPGDS